MRRIDDDRPQYTNYVHRLADSGLANQRSVGVTQTQPKVWGLAFGGALGNRGRCGSRRRLRAGAAPVNPAPLALAGPSTPATGRWAAPAEAGSGSSVAVPQDPSDATVRARAAPPDPRVPRVRHFIGQLPGHVGQFMCSALEIEQVVRVGSGSGHQALVRRLHRGQRRTQVMSCRLRTVRKRCHALSYTVVARRSCGRSPSTGPGADRSPDPPPAPDVTHPPKRRCPARPSSAAPRRSHPSGPPRGAPRPRRPPS